MNQESTTPDLDKNDFLLSVINGFEDGKWRKSEFRKFIFDNIAQTGLSAEERDNLYSESPYTSLTESIKNLRLVDKDNGKGSEIAEIVLYGIMRYHYHALPVVPKIFYKQNPNDNAKGADSVHIVLDDQGDFSLWLGEAKFYNDIADERLYDPIKSVFDTISTDRIKKENSIITNIRDLEYVIIDPNIRKKVQTILRRDTSIDEIRKRLHVPVLLLHECSKTNKATELTEAYLNDIKEYHLNRAQKYFESQNNKQKKENIHGYEHIQFHLILFPVPQKKDIVNWFVERAKQIKEDA
ncbi:DUF1837 domain-containing protein [Marseilla massiliensis]|uniref:HamA C-terminal domain-containing protein n=1 Tax=Marseilla massiliensis TaxID=1841864 RepID=UPI0030C7DD68